MATEKPKNIYFDDSVIYPLIVEHQRKVKLAKEKKLPLPIPPDTIGVAIMALCENLAKNGRFSGYTFIDEMIEDAIIDCVKAIETFDVEKWNQPFQYFNKCAWWAFTRRIEEEAKENYIKHKNYSRSIIDYGLTDNTEVGEINVTTDATNYVIQKFEDKMRKKKARLEEKKKKQAEENRLDIQENGV